MADLSWRDVLARAYLCHRYGIPAGVGMQPATAAQQEAAYTYADKAIADMRALVAADQAARYAAGAALLTVALTVAVAANVALLVAATWCKVAGGER